MCKEKDDINGMLNEIIRNAKRAKKTTNMVEMHNSLKTIHNVTTKAKNEIVSIALENMGELE